jgi:hypothetical protein
MMPVIRVYKINVIVIEDKGYGTVFYGVGIGIGFFVIIKNII